jgi:hypothetical protein
MLGQFVTRMRKFIGQSDVKHMTCLVKTITSVLKASTDIITDIPACPIGLTEVLAIVSCLDLQNYCYSICIGLFNVVIPRKVVCML